MGDAPERCAPASERRSDPLLATAAPAERFVLVEQPGAWGRNALRDSRIAAPVLARLLARCHAADARLLLVRRAHRGPTTSRAFAVADARPGHEAIAWGRFDDDAELADIDPTRFPAAPSTSPAFLVCTHGRRDPCCAARGWPVAVALTDAFPEQTWQCSHVGGDRFAANVLAMPHGVYYGRVEPDEVEALATAHESGEVYLERVRGRTTTSPAAQAAIVHVRRVLGETRLDALTPAGTIHLGDGRWQVRLRGRPGTLMVTVQSAAGARPGLLTCHAQREAHPPRYEIVEIRQLP